AAGVRSAAAAPSAGLKDSRRVRPGTGAAAITREGEATGAPVPAPTSKSGAAAHPHGKGHEKQLPSASAHGQQTAATHKSAGHGAAGAKSHPAHPAKPSHSPKPSHPPHSSTPGAEKAPSPTPPTHTAPEGKSNVKAAPPAGGGGALAESETGKEKP
ncbi:MAG: hypothetical protein JWM24_1617, partial [Solirubrobacterales bacterium]|nr:hypothetical protein [Solirubrobacterales bacterium]